MGKFPKSSSCEYYQYWGAWTKQQAVGESIHINISNMQLTSIALTRTLWGNKYFAHFFSIEYLLHLCILCSAIYQYFYRHLFFKKNYWRISGTRRLLHVYKSVSKIFVHISCVMRLGLICSHGHTHTRTIMSSVANLWHREYNDPTLENTPRSI